MAGDGKSNFSFARPKKAWMGFCHTRLRRIAAVYPKDSAGAFRDCLLVCGGYNRSRMELIKKYDESLRNQKHILILNLESIGFAVKAFFATRANAGAKCQASPK